MLRALFMSMMVAVILATAGMTGITLIAVGSLVVGVAMVFFPAIAHPYMKKVTGSDDVAIGHFSTLSYVLAGFIGSKFGNKEHSTEDMNVPKSLLFLRDTPVAISFTMIIIFLLTCLFAGADAVKELSGGKNWFMFSIMQSITFAAGVYIILKWSTKTGHRVRVFSSIDFPIRLVVTHHYIRAVLVRCNIQRYSPLLRELHR